MAPHPKLSDTHKVRTIVIDAGHGGHDPGCHGAKSYEKEVALKLALKLGAYINEGMPDVNVIYTRKTDTFIALRDRARIANEANADLFISIHLNAASPKAYGTETYVMGLHKSEANLAVAKRENEVILMEDDYEEHYKYDPKSPVAHIIWSLHADAYIEQSAELAGHVETEFRERAKRHSRGVKQAGFVVLYRTYMPSILVECGFLTNPEEEKFLRSDEGQSIMASAIFRAFRKYKADTEAANLAPLTPASELAAASKDEDLYIPEIHRHDDPDNPVEFRVQFMSSTKPIDLNHKDLKGLDEITADKNENGWIRYCTGHYTDYVKARDALEKVRKNGFKDAYLVAYKEGTRIKLSEARDYLSTASR